MHILYTMQCIVHSIHDIVYIILVWTPCLVHRCVCIWRYILQNYNYKLHFQNLSIYHSPHALIGTLAAENLDVCTACDPWDSNIQLTMVKDRRLQIYPKCHSNRKVTMILIYQNLGGAPPGAGHAFPRQRHMHKGGLFISVRVFFPVWCHPWMDGKNFTKNDHNVLYYM
jgi:hypothetical protein